MNKLTKYACILTAVAGAVACSGGKKAQGDYAIIPLPQEVVTQGSAPFLLKPSTPISYQEGDAEMEQTARFLASYIKEATQTEASICRLLPTSKIRKVTGCWSARTASRSPEHPMPAFSMVCKPCASLSPPRPKEWTSNCRPPASTTTRGMRIAVCTWTFPGTFSPSTRSNASSICSPCTT